MIYCLKYTYRSTQTYLIEIPAHFYFLLKMNLKATFNTFRICRLRHYFDLLRISFI